MRVDTRPRIRNAGRPAEKSAPAFLQWVRSRRCILEKTGACSGKVRACHVDYAGDKGMGTKVSDRHSFPACDGHHDEQHRIGWRTFEAKYRIICLDLAAQFWRAWPGRLAWERKHD
ncbi:hypothetical protein CVO77_00420 [Sphingopyxis lindanitolerans]|uniref:DUF968 domain-containing protein n=1 Tax=Sphingopyxis lindanitolerans TaxID=2054227 RepID=A0A2S8BAQ1_9SPHN|nr:DUF968 domain-containing protein [Sphingopyxis lindanitolerans]PQM29437.1 hypothetical protein CVO77_00420 [Sphingopyxis lindanitolerans]